MQRRKNTIRAYRSVITVDSMDEVPAKLGGTVYLVERGGTQRWAVLMCPCQCGKRIEVNLMRSRWPRWRARRHADQTITLMPSLWMPTNECGSHFWLYRNGVVWVSERAPRAPRAIGRGRA
jgi:hypothetical protein